MSLFVGRGRRGDSASAREQFATLLPVRERILSADTLTTRDSLACWTEIGCMLAMVVDRTSGIVTQKDQRPDGIAHLGANHDSVDPDADLIDHRLSSLGPLDVMPPDQAQAPALRLRDRTAALVKLAGYGPGDPLVLGVRQDSAPTAFLASGRTAAGEPLTVGTVVYTASLSKQITAACAALLVRQGRLDIESTLAQWMPELPAWAGTIRVRHLIHRTSGLPEGVEFDELHRAELDRTTPGVIQALVQLDHLDSKPGTQFRYCNAGYVCLAVIVERAAGRPLPDFAREHVFQPLGMLNSRYWSGPAPHPPGAAPTRAHTAGPYGGSAPRCAADPDCGIPLAATIPLMFSCPAHEGRLGDEKVARLTAALGEPAPEHIRAMDRLTHRRRGGSGGARRVGQAVPDGAAVRRAAAAGHRPRAVEAGRQAVTAWERREMSHRPP
ncbi:serine hydrolase domain-containing protein [Nonomuraea angiospora]|uniref:serine hydrolase domain-containing protein n=1 Tax=Nonomuraea angiospora TaxID=46172 RepID=UPI0033CBE7EF